MQTLNHTDADKVQDLAARMERDGWQGRPVLVILMGNERLALTGSHRVAAADQAGIDLSAYEIDADDYSDDEVTQLVEARDDENRLTLLRSMDQEAAALMAAEIEANDY